MKLVNIKDFPADPTPESLYYYHFNREARRKHTKEEKTKYRTQLWNKYMEAKNARNKGMQSTLGRGDTSETSVQENKESE